MSQVSSNPYSVSEDPPAFVTVAMLAKRLNIGKLPIYQAIKAGRVKAVTFGGSIRIPTEEALRVEKEGY